MKETSSSVQLSNPQLKTTFM